MRHAQQSPNAAQVHAVHIQPHRLLSQGGAVAMRRHDRRILAPTDFAAIPLTAGVIASDLALALSAPTVRPQNGQVMVSMPTHYHRTRYLRHSLMNTAEIQG